MELTVADDGVGFELDAVDSTQHFGLSLIAERVKAARGVVEVRTELGSGTTIHALIPVAGNKKAPD
jgi:signal transduction histidine kinase